MDSARELPGALGPSVSQPQWESGNVSVRFPFADDAGPEGYPFNAISDACVVIPSGREASDETVSVGCLHIGPSMVSVMIYAGDEPVLCRHVPKSVFEPFTPFALEPMRPGCSGFVSFGDIRFESFRDPVMLRDRVRLSDSAVIRPVVGRLTKFIKPETGSEASGIVGIVVPQEVSVARELDPDGREVGHESVVGFSLDADGLDLVSVGCDAAEAEAGSPVPVSSVNGLQPDENGVIAVVFARDESEVPE